MHGTNMIMPSGCNSENGDRKNVKTTKFSNKTIAINRGSEKGSEAKETPHFKL